MIIMVHFTYNRRPENEPQWGLHVLSANMIL